MQISTRATSRTLGLALLLAGATSGNAQVSGVTGTIVVTNKAPFTATVIDVATGKALATLPTGRGPHEIAMSTDGRTAVVTDYGSGANPSLTVIDVPGLRVARTISLGQYRSPHGIVFLPGDSIVAVTSEATGNVVLVHVNDGAVRKAVATGNAGSHMVGVAADGKTAFTGNMGSHTVSQLDLATGAIVRVYPVPNTPEAINVTPNGREVWVGSNAMGRVSLLDPATGSVTTAADSVSWPYRVLFTPDVSTVVIPDMNRNDVRFLDRATHRELGRLSFPGAGPQGITITPDGRHIFLSLSKEARVAVIDVRARKVLGYIPSGETPDGVVFTTRVLPR
ncbi:MAG: YncE family protein [Gemmatimonas sp.]